MKSDVTNRTENPRAERVKAWSVHFFTMSGLLWALLALSALLKGDYKLMWAWLIVSLVVDTVDGPLARNAKVGTVVPYFSGVLVDIIVDYLTWTFIPCMFMVSVLPLGPEPLPVVAAALILVSSMFCYANTRMKSSDWYFVGFPAAWNFIAVSLWLIGSNVFINWVVVVVFTVLAVIPWKWLHPFRVRHLRIPNAAAAIVWVITTGALIWYFPESFAWLWVIWTLSGLWILGVSAHRTIVGTQERSEEASAK